MKNIQITTEPHNLLINIVVKKIQSMIHYNIRMFVWDVVWRNIHRTVRNHVFNNDNLFQYNSLQQYKDNL
jgi:hypothetical protein